MSLLYNKNKFYLLCVFLFCCNFSVASELPEPPVIDRDVAMMAGGKFVYPHIPPVHTSADGRIGLIGKNIDRAFHFVLLSPEKLSGPFIDSVPGSEILAVNSSGMVDKKLLKNNAIGNGKRVFSHATLCDVTVPPKENSPKRNNPYACGVSMEHDCYDLDIITTTAEKIDGINYRRLWRIPVSVEVGNPKQANAYIEEVILRDADPSEVLLPAKEPSRMKSFLEASITGDGNLLIGRIGTSAHPWTNPHSTDENGQPIVKKQFTDIVYSYSENANCDVNQLTEFHPISHAPYDPRINKKYGFAMHAFRDPENRVIADGDDLQGTYPWIDREGDNLFLTTLGEKIGGRYEARCLTGLEYCEIDPVKLGKTRGLAVAGLWTHGKIVLLDNTLNNNDFGHGAKDVDHNELKLYKTIDADQDGWVRVGAGRDNTTRVPGSVINSSLVGSPQNMFNYLPHMHPVTPRDVVWFMSNGKGSEEFAFDDYLDPDSFINANMAPSLSYGRVTERRARFIYRDKGGPGKVRVQNAATAPRDRWNIPRYGELLGNARTESVALGGISGRGVWLDQQSGIAFDISSQPQNVNTTDWYMGLFIDPRFGYNWRVKRQLVAFPDGSKLELLGRASLAYVDSGGYTLHKIPFPKAIPANAWSHIGLQIKEGGSQVELYFNGYLLNEWSAPPGKALFQLSPGKLVVGVDVSDSSSKGFAGWVDEFKLLAHDVSPELACNHAHGTLVGILSLEGKWAKIANLYPVASHDLIRNQLYLNGQSHYRNYACYHDYRADYAAHLGNIPDGTRSVRNALLFPEGPLIANMPRPDSSKNSFCLSCHQSSGKDGLSIEALTSSDDAPEARLDNRRQPMQAPPRVFGFIPANWLGKKPAEAFVTGPQGVLIDDLVLPKK